MNIFGFPLELLILLFAAALVAGFIDALAGGGGLIVLPALILTGLPPISALATNKLQGTVGTATSTYRMLKSKQVVWGDVKYLMQAAFVGSMMGAIGVQFVDAEVLDFVIPVVLLFMVVYFLFSSHIETGTGDLKMSSTIYRRVVVPIIGWYDGMFGPGTGSFFALSGVSFRGYGLIDATAIAKTLNFATNIAALCVFLLVGKVVWIIGFVMMLGQFIGSWGGSHCLLRIDPKYLRMIVVTMCLGMLGKYAFSKGWLSYGFF